MAKNMLEKIKDKSYVDSLSPRRKREVCLISKVLSEEELKFYTSIPSAYSEARKRWILSHIEDKDEQEMYLKSDRPIFIRRF